MRIVVARLLQKALLVKVAEVAMIIRSLKLVALLNVVSTVSAVVIMLTLGGRYVFPKDVPIEPDPSTTLEGPAVGRVLPLDGVDFKANGTTVIMAMKTTCMWGKAVAPFYRQIVTAKDTHYRVVAVLPDGLAQAKEYLRSLNLPISAVFQAELRELDVRGTPALIVADEQGRVRASWLGGTLSDPQKRQISATLRLGSDDNRLAGALARARPPLTLSQAAAVLRSPGIIIVDVRQPQYFSKEHVAESINIPINQVYRRALHELPAVDAPIAVVCGSCPDCLEVSGERRLHNLCSSAYSAFKDLGFSDVTSVMFNPSDLRSAELDTKVVGSASGH